MKDFQQKFLNLALEAKALEFGNFTLKSGRQSPYFFNAAKMLNGSNLYELAGCYEEAIKDANIQFDCIYGPAYKGIFLGSILSTVLSKNGKNYPLSFNRKEVKDHGEGGSLIGAKPKGRVLVVDDVISSGLAIREGLKFLAPYDVELAGALVTLDRQEMGQTSKLMASAELKRDGLDIFSVISLDDLLEASEVIDSVSMAAIKNYRDNYRGENV